MSHWLDLRKEQLVLEKVLHTEANQVLFTAHNSEEELYVYRGDLVLDQIELTKLHETPLSQWGAPGQSKWFSPMFYQVLYSLDEEGLKTIVLGLNISCTSSAELCEEPTVLLQLKGEYSIVFLDAMTLLAFPSDGSPYSAYGRILSAFEPLKKSGCFEQWPLVAPRETVISAESGWAIWDDSTSEDYDRAESALSGGSQKDEAIWSLRFWREDNALVGERMPLAVGAANGWARVIGLDFKGRLWYRTGEVLKDQEVNGELTESIWSQELKSLQLPQPIERYKRRSQVLTTAAYDSHVYVKTAAGYALYQIVRSEKHIEVKGIFGDNLTLSAELPGYRTHFEGKWSDGYLLSQWYESHPTKELKDRLHFWQNWPDTPMNITEDASCTISGDWCILCSKSL